ncbi:MAG: GNAT family N-acetyltransferase [Chloroflexi bacterium]|nr:GNAT family N-acetyltransferase [Chloroflexota bacterium]
MPSSARPGGAITLREVGPSDHASIAAILTRSYPHEPTVTAEQIGWIIGRADPQRPKVALVAEAEGAIVGFGYLRGAPPLPGLLLNVEVDVSHRRRGIGTRLLEAVTTRAADHGLSTMVSVVAADTGSLAFAARHGFVERDRRSESKIDLSTFDVNAFADVLQRAADRRIRFAVMADIDTPEMRRRLFTLANQVTGDMPSVDPMEPLTYDQFVAAWLEGPSARRELLVIGLEDDDPVAVSMVTVFPGGIAYNWMTGVMPSHRGRGLGLAAKVEALRRAKAAGIDEVWTENHNRNAPMLAINARLGYEPMPEVVQLVRG